MADRGMTSQGSSNQINKSDLSVSKQQIHNIHFLVGGGYPHSNLSDITEIFNDIKNYDVTNSSDGMNTTNLVLNYVDHDLPIKYSCLLDEPRVDTFNTSECLFPVSTSTIKNDLLVHKDSIFVHNTLTGPIGLNKSTQNVVKLIESSHSLAANEVIIIDNDMNVNKDKMITMKNKELLSKAESKNLTATIVNSNISSNSKSTPLKLDEKKYINDKTPWNMFEKPQNILDTPKKQCHKDTVTEISTNSTINETSNSLIEELDFDFDQLISQTSLPELYNDDVYFNDEYFLLERNKTTEEPMDTVSVSQGDSFVSENNLIIKAVDTFKDTKLDSNKSKTTNQETKQLKESLCQSDEIDDNQSSAESVPGIVILQNMITEVMSKIELDFSVPLRTHLSDAKQITCDKILEIKNEKAHRYDNQGFEMITVDSNTNNIRKKNESQEAEIIKLNEIIFQIANDKLLMEAKKSDESVIKENEEREKNEEDRKKREEDERMHKEDNEINKKEDEEKIKIEEKQNRLEKKDEEERERKVIDQMLNERLGNELEDKRNDEVKMRLEVTEKIIDNNLHEIVENILEKDIRTDDLYETEIVMRIKMPKVNNKTRGIKCISNSPTELTRMRQLESQKKEKSIKRRIEIKNLKNNQDVAAQIRYIELQKQTKELQSIEAEKAEKEKVHQIISRIVKCKAEIKIVEEAELERIKNDKIKMVKEVKNMKMKEPENNQLEKQPSKKRGRKRRIDIKNLKNNQDVAAQIRYIELQKQTKELQSIEAEKAEKEKVHQIISRIVKCKAEIKIVEEAELERIKNDKIKMVKEVKNMKMKEPENNQLEKQPSKKRGRKRRIDIQNEKHESKSSNKQSYQNVAIMNRIEPPPKRSRQSLRLIEKESIKNKIPTYQDASYIRGSLKLEQNQKQKTGSLSRTINVQQNRWISAMKYYDDFY